MTLPPTITLGVCLAAGLAAGIGLARPGGVAHSPGPSPIAAQASSVTTPAGSPARPGYGATPPAHSSVQTGAPSQSVAPVEPAVVTIEGFAFASPVAVAPGATVEVVNADSTGHTLTAAGGAFDTGPLASAGRGTFTAPAGPGSYAFFCAIHPSMRGTLTVAG